MTMDYVRRGPSRRAEEEAEQDAYYAAQEQEDLEQRALQEADAREAEADGGGLDPYPPDAGEDPTAGDGGEDIFGPPPSLPDETVTTPVNELPSFPDDTLPDDINHERVARDVEDGAPPDVRIDLGDFTDFEGRPIGPVARVNEDGSVENFSGTADIGELPKPGEGDTGAGTGGEHGPGDGTGDEFFNGDGTGNVPKDDFFLFAASPADTIDLGELDPDSVSSTPEINGFIFGSDEVADQPADTSAEIG